MRTVIFVLLVMILQGGVQAEIPENNEKSKKIIPDFYMGFQTGQYVKARYFPNRPSGPEDKTPYHHLWQGVMVGRLGFSAIPNNWLTLKLGIEATIDYNNWPLRKAFSPYLSVAPNYGFYLHEAYGLFSLLKESPNVDLEIALGQFAYKYNPEVRDLGEYLFRTGTYPLYIVNKFDFPLARLTGLRLGFSFSTPTKLFDQNLLSFNIDGLLLTEREMMPFHDFSLAFIGKVNVFKAIELGGGLNFSHLFSVNDSFTTPKVTENMFIQNHNDTGYYTFKGTKLMLRATVDPVFFLRGKDGFLGDLVGNEGLKFYSEVAFIGLESYPAQADSINGDYSYNPYGYDNLKSKRPVLLGFSLPMWKILDVSVYENRVKLKGCDNIFRQIIVKDHGRVNPTFILTNDFELSLADILIVYAKR